MPGNERRTNVSIDSGRGLTRRAVLKAGAATVLPMFSGARVGWSADKPGETAARRMTRGAPQVFVDLDDVESTENIKQQFHSAQKHPANPVLDGGKEWERVMGGPCGSFIYDPDEKLFKVWYQGVIGDERGTTHSYGPHTLNYAISQDGVHWERPNLGIHEFTWDGQSTRDNNIVVPQTYHGGQDHWESVLKDLFDPDAARRYKAIGWSSYDPHSSGFCETAGSCGIWSMTSADGLRWNHSPEAIFHYKLRPGKSDLGPVGDAQALMIDTPKRRYVAFLRGVEGNRLYSTSEDFVHWSPPLESIPRIAGKAGSPTYNHVGFNYGDQYLGFASHYAIEDDGVHHLRLRLLTSRDGLQFSYPGPDPYSRPALVDVGDYGDWDRYMCMLTGAPPIRVGDLLYIYYRGYSETHNRGGDKPQDSYYAGANGLATIRADGFASLASGFDGGTVTTKPLVFDGETLSVNAKANHHGSSVVAEMLDEKQEPIPQYTAADSVPMTQDLVSASIRWKERAGLGELAGRVVRVRFHLKNARLYSYQVS